MAKRARTARSTGAFVTSFLNGLRKLVSQFKGVPAHFWLRGHASCSWDLEPTIERASFASTVEERVREGTSQHATSLEQSLVMSFIRELKDVGPSSPHDDVSLYVSARHAGLPTRLLDWTTNPLVALYFAVSDQEATEDDAAIYGLDIAGFLSDCFEKTRGPYKEALGRLKSTSPIRPGLPVTQHLCNPHTHDSETLHHCVRALTTGLFAQFLESPTILNDPATHRSVWVLASTALIPFVPFTPEPDHPRVIAQGSRFSLHLPTQVLDQMLSYLISGPTLDFPRADLETLRQSDRFQEWIIPREAKQEIVRELRVLGIHRASLFRDPDSIAAEIADTYL